MQRHEIAVVGAGIAGLVVAHRLRARGIDAVALEAGERPGGVIRSPGWAGTVVEAGPNSFLAGEPLLAVVGDLGLQGEIEEAAPGARRRYIVRGGRLAALPTSPVSFLTTRALSARARLRLLAEPFLHGRAPRADESVRAFFERHFGTEVYRYVAAPFTSGVYAGDPEKLSARAAFPLLAELEARHPSLLRAALSRPKRAGGAKRPRLRSVALRGGNQRLAEALGAALGAGLRLGARVERIGRGEGGFALALADGPAVAATAVVLAAPAAASAPLVEQVAPPLARTLAGFRTARVAVVHLVVPRERLVHPHDGFGHLVPREEGLRHLGAIWTSALFPSRAPADKAVFTVFLGGALDPQAAGLGEADAVALADRELRALGLYRGEPEAARRDPGPARIAQYELGHLARVEAAERAAAEAGRIWLAGSSYRGVAVGDCVREAEALALRIAASFGR